MTDVHLDFVDRETVDALIARLRASGAGAVAITGDIAEADSVEAHLETLAAGLDVPLYFVLGNHDYYGASIEAVRKRMDRLCSRTTSLCYLSGSEPVALTPGWALVGHDGWGDGRAGDYARSPVMLNDYVHIKDLAGLDKQARGERLAALGRQAAEHLHRVLPQALALCSRVLLLTHVPPLTTACWHQGKTADDDWAPHFVCQSVGEAILEIMAAHPQQQLRVLCGHTHSEGIDRPRPNITIMTGAADYGRPAIADTLELD
ncbi:MAG: metallophosphoesterase [Myxococcales bacterium]|nr:metallophosphoesterase [Myxococcales bacterium]